VSAGFSYSKVLGPMLAAANVLIGGVLDALEGRHLDEEIEVLRGNPIGKKLCVFFASIAQGKVVFEGAAVSAPIACAAVLQAVGRDFVEGIWTHVFSVMRDKELLRRHFLLDESFQHYIHVIDKVGWTTDALFAFVLFLPEVVMARFY
jgi:hypothetical protein